MSDFVDMLVEMLPLHSELQKEDNQGRIVLDRTIGEYMDREDDLFDQLFLSTASGGWLDAHGKDYGVTRRLGEDDDSYRERIVFEKLEYLTVSNLQNIYNLTLYAFVSLYDPTSNQLTSDNPYSSKRYMSFADESTQRILDDKFVLDNGILWLDEVDGRNPNSIVSVDGVDVLYKYIQVLSKTELREFFL